MEEQIFDHEFYSKLNRLKLNAKLKLHGGTGGNRRSSAKGTSVEYSDFREYLPGDDVRRIDWNAYGRMDRLFVKLFMEEKEALFHILVDGSASMDYGENGKSRTGLQLAGLFAHLALNQMDRVVVASLREGSLLRSKSMTGMQSFQKVLRHLEAFRFEGRTNLMESIRKIPFSSKGITIILSDFMDRKEPEEWLRYLAYQKQEVILVHVMAGEEWEPDWEGTHNLIDMETEEEVRITLTGKVRRAYENELDQFQAKLRKLCRAYGASYLTVDTREPLDAFIYKGLRDGRLSSL